MQGKGFLQKLFSTEYSFFNAFNFLLSSIRPISVSGANLLFDRNAINYQKQLKKHKHLASGDDYFLLKEFRRKHLPVYISNETKLDRKSTRLNSSHVRISYAVFCLKKKKK